MTCTQGGGCKGVLKRSVFLSNAQSRFESVVLDAVLGPPRLCLAASRVGDRDEEVAGRNGRE